jgi:uncharacterized protein YheU (UPF0270 family)
MPHFVEVPSSRLAADVRNSLLEEYASRDGTDYGEREFSLAEKVENLERQLASGDLCILFESETEQWDLVAADQASALLSEQ